MADERNFRIRRMRPDQPRALDLEAKPDATVEYDGTLGR
jgi:hypothetical protein